jgi:hypothetical protein
MVRRQRTSGDCLGDSAPQHHREVDIEPSSFLRREGDPLPDVCDRARERADTDSKRERFAEVAI